MVVVGVHLHVIHISMTIMCGREEQIERMSIVDRCKIKPRQTPPIRYRLNIRVMSLFGLFVVFFEVHNNDNFQNK